MVRRGGAEIARRRNQLASRAGRISGSVARRNSGWAGKKRLNQPFVFRWFGGTGDVEQPAAGAERRGGAFQHGPLPGREGVQIGLRQAGLDLRVAPQDSQGRARGVQYRAIHALFFNRQGRGGVGPHRLDRTGPPAPQIRRQFLEAPLMLVHCQEQPAT